MLVGYNTVACQTNYWVQMGGMYGGSIVRIEINQKGDIFLATTASIFRSTDNGENWIEANSGLTSSTPNSIAVNKKGDIFVGADMDGLFRSTDNGNSWVQRVIDPPHDGVFSVAVDSSGVVYAAMKHWFVFRSTDNGDTWTNTGLFMDIPRCFAVAPSGDVFLGTATQGVFRSCDHGITWSRMDTGLGDPYVSDLAIDSAGTIFAPGEFGGVRKSTDNGASWTQISLRETLITSIAISSRGSLFVGTTKLGVLRSTNDGNSWTNVGATQSIVTSLAADSKGSVFAGSFTEGVFRSTDNGDSWYQKTEGMTDVKGKCFARGKNEDLIAGTGRNGVYRLSADGGAWEQTAMTKGEVLSVAISEEGDWFAGRFEGVFRSSDKGKSWGRVGLPTDYIYSLAALANGILLAGTYSHGVFASTDRGETWTSAGLIASVYILSVDARGDIFAGTNNGIYRSLDSAKSWAFSVGGFPCEIFCSSDGQLYAGIESNGVFRSTNWGVSWSQFGLAGKLVEALRAGSSGEMFASVWDEGMYRTSDNGKTWSAVNSGLMRPYVECLAINKQGHLLAGTLENGIFRSAKPVMEVKRSGNVGPVSTRLHQNYPNPFNPSTTIEFSLAQSGFVTLKIFDVLGSEVALLTSKYLEAGHHRVHWDAARRPSGIYFSRLQFGSFSETRKLIFIR